MKSSLIKHYVESEFKVKDISLRVRSNRLSFIRNVYFKLCRTLNKEALHEIGSTIGRNHATVLHGLRTFDELDGTELFKEYSEAYKRLYEFLSDRTVFELKKDYGAKLFRIIEKNHRVIDSLLVMKESKALRQIAELPKKDLEEFEKLAQGFYKIKSIQNQSP